MKSRCDLVAVARAPSTLLAEELQSLLEASGIEAFLDPYSVEEAVAGEFYCEFTGIDVMVREADAARTKEVFTEARRAARVLEECCATLEETAMRSMDPF